jgi:hypothetical protein
LIKRIIKGILGALSVASKETALKKFRTELSTGSRVVNSRQNAGQSHTTLIANKQPESVAKFRNYMQEEIKNRLRVLVIVRAKLFCLFIPY